MPVTARRRDLAWLAGLVGILLVVLLWPYVVDGHPFGVGPDVPVYLWWTRVGASEGLSRIGSRPGAPALAAALGATLSLSVAAVTAGLASALGVAVGTAAAALVRAAGDRAAPAWILAGGLAGVFSVHLVAGYLANLLLVVCFLAAAACLAGRRRAWWAAALLLAGGGLAHLPFLIHSAIVLAATAVLAWRAGARDEARDVVLSVGVGGLVAGAGILATVAGSGPIAAETSRDGFLRSAGLDANLVDAYRERFRLRAARYVQWIAVPAAILGAIDAEGFLRRFLGSWLVVMAVAIPVGWITGWFPPDRIVTFGFAVPIGAALGLVRVLRRRTAHPWIARTGVVLLAGWMIVGALLAWGRQSSFVRTREATRSADAMRYAEGVTAAGTPIVVVVDDLDDTVSFNAARTANIFRAAAHPARAADVHVFVGSVTDLLEGSPTRRPSAEYSALSELTLAEIPDDPDPLVIALRPFYPGDDVEDLTERFDGFWTSGGERRLGVRGEDPPRLSWGPSNAGAVAFATVAILLLLGILGLGYAFASFDERVTAIATAPAFGAASLTIAAVLLDLLGLRLAELAVALAASALAGLGGLALFLLVRQRQRDRDATA